MGRASAAGAIYFLVLFGLGFLLGPVRILVLEPRLGPVGAILLEAIPMLAAMVLVAPWAARLLEVPPLPVPRLAMGVAGLILLVLAETALDALLRGRVLWAERIATTDGRIGLLLLLAFALMPLLRRRA
jgi:hypothetical protein